MLSSAELSRLTGAEVLANLYCRGYWSRIAGKPRPSHQRAQSGWDQADSELAAEAVKGE